MEHDKLSTDSTDKIKEKSEKTENSLKQNDEMRSDSEELKPMNAPEVSTHEELATTNIKSDDKRQLEEDETNHNIEEQLTKKRKIEDRVDEVVLEEFEV